MDSETTLTEDDGKPYRKVGGWLLFYVIISIFGDLTSTALGVRDLLRGEGVAMSVLNIAQYVLSLVAVVLMVRLDWRGVWLTRALLALGTALSFGWLAYRLIWPGAEALSGSNIAGTLASTVIGILWLLYFLRSRRVNRDTLWRKRPGYEATSAPA